MPTLQQLPQVATTNPTDLVLLSQQDDTCTVDVATLLATTQPKLTLATGAMLGRVSLAAGAPEPVQLGLGLSLREGVLGLDTSSLAPVNSPEFTGTPTAPTPAPDDDGAAIATTAYVQAQLVGRASVALGARLPEIDASDALVTVAGGVPRRLGDQAADILDVRDFGAKGDVTRITAAVTVAAGATLLQASGAAFVTGDIGKLIVVSGAGVAGGPLVTSIAGVTDGTHILLTSAAATQLTGAQAVVSYGTDDFAAIASALAQAVAFGGRVIFPPGSYGLATAIALPESGSVQIVGSGPGASALVALAAMTGGVVSKGTVAHRDSQVADLRIDANALAAYALDLQCAEGYRVERVVLANGFVAGLRLGDGSHLAREIRVSNARVENDMLLFPTTGAAPPYNVVVGGSANCLCGVSLANATVAGLRDSGAGDNIYLAVCAGGTGTVQAGTEPQYGYWISGSATLLGCEVNGVQAVANSNSVAGVNGAGMRIDGAGVRVLGGRLQNLAGGAVGILLTAGTGGGAPGDCYIAGNLVDIGETGVADATMAIVQQGTPQTTTIICDNPGAALWQGTPGVVASGVRGITPAASGVSVYQVTYADPQTLCVSQSLAADLVLALPVAPNLGARYRCVRTSTASGAGVLRLRPANGPADGSDDVIVLAYAGSFADVEWTGSAWQLTAQGSLDGTQMTLSGSLVVTGATSLQAATAMTPAATDNSSSIATTAFVKEQGYLQATNNLTDVANAASARGALGLGSLAVQNAAAITVTGGAVDGTTIGRTVPSTGSFSTLSATMLTLSGAAGLTQSGNTINLSCGNGLAAQHSVAAGNAGYLVSNATNTAVTLSPGQANADLVLLGSGTGTARAAAGLAVSGGILSAASVNFSGGTIDGVTLGTTAGIGPIKGVAKAQFFDASWEAGSFTAAGGAGANDTLTLVNASSAHLSLWSPNKSLGWGINIDTTTGNLRLLRSAGGGSIALGNATPVVISGNLTVSGTLALGAAGSSLGFYGVTGGPRPTVTGSRGGNAALASLLSALAGLGLLTDASTA